MASVVFDVDAWRTLYPKLSEVYTDDATLQAYFDLAAATLLDNTDSSIVKDTTERAALFNMLVCHLATLAQRDSGVVGAITSASEGSVSASFDVPSSSNTSAAWYMQTPCGWAYYRAMSKYRLGGRYIAGRKNCD